MAEKITIARPYAQAIFDLAKEQGELSRWSDMLTLATSVASNEEMANVVDNPDLTREQVGDLFVDVCGDGLSDTGKNMVRLLAENDRILFLPEIFALFEEARATEEGTVTAEVISATELSQAQRKSIIAALNTRLEREVSLECRVDSSLLGGAIIRAGDVVIDGSVSGKLNKLSSSLNH